MSLQKWKGWWLICNWSTTCLGMKNASVYKKTNCVHYLNRNRKCVKWPGMWNWHRYDFANVKEPPAPIGRFYSSSRQPAVNVAVNDMHWHPPLCVTCRKHCVSLIIQVLKHLLPFSEVGLMYAAQWTEESQVWFDVLTLE